MSVLIDNCVVLSVKVDALFVLNGELIVITLNKQTNTTSVNLRGAFICFILCDTILSLNICFDQMVTLGFSSHIRKKAFPNFLSGFYQRKKIEQ